MAIPAGQFPTDAELTRVKFENRFDKLYECEVYDEDFRKGVFRLKEHFHGDEDNKEILAIALNTPQLIIDAGVDFLFGEPVKIRYTADDAESEGDDKKNSNDDIQNRINKLVKDQDLQTVWRESSAPYQHIGHTQFMVRRDVVMSGGVEKNKIIIDEIPFDNWYPSFSDVPIGGKPSSIRIASYISATDNSNVSVRYLYIMEHFAGSIEHSLWTEESGKAQQQVPLNTLPNLAESIGVTANDEGLVPLTMTHIEETNVKELLTFQIDTQKTIKKRFGRSILKCIMPLIEEVNDRLTQMSLQFWKNFDPVLEVPSSTLIEDRNGDVKRKSMDIIVKDEGQPDSRYVTNDNPLVEPMMDYIKMFILESAKLTKTPAAFIMEDEKGAGIESSDTLKTRFVLFMKRIKAYQDSYDDGIRKTIRLALLLEDGTEIDEDDLEIIFDPGLPREMKVEVEWIAEAYRSGLISRRRALAMLHGLEGDQLDEELLAIEKEEQRAGVTVFPLDEPEEE